MKRLLYCLSFFLLLGCRRVADFDFDTQTQSLTINDGYFYDICFENDSVTSDGKLYEGALLLIWEDSTCVPPKKIKLSNIPRGYTISRGGLPSRSEKINLKARLYDFFYWNGSCRVPYKSMDESEWKSC